MKPLLVVGSLFVLLDGSPHPVAGDEPKVKPPQLSVKLGKIPDVKLTPRPAVNETQVKHIKELIADLAKLDSADIGLSATMRGQDFSPVDGQSGVGVLLFTDHKLKKSQTVRDLVALGPDALPYLLDALDDKRPTKITITHGGFLGGMWYSSGVDDFNPLNPEEAAIDKARAEADAKEREDAAKGKEDHGKLNSYTVKVGDVCFVAIGQIVGRRYSAVSYVPTAIIGINSPTHDAKLCADVRATWSSKDPSTKLMNSLLLDYATEGIFNGKSLDGWGDGNDRQCAAALRLLYYFPKDSTPLIADRLAKLDVGKGDFMLQSVANGVRAEDFIKTVSWCKEPSIRSALTAIFKRAENADDLLAAMTSVEDADLIRTRLAELIRKLPGKEWEWGEGYKLLIALGEQAPDAAKDTFQRYLKVDNLQRRRTVCRVLEKVKMPWDVELLAPLLEDKRESIGQYRVEDPKPGEFIMDGPWLPVRICDAAADTLCRNHPELKFTHRGQHADLDKQIAAMQEQLKRKK
jgi:hypothetical protein